MTRKGPANADPFARYRFPVTEEDGQLQPLVAPQLMHL